VAATAPAATTAPARAAGSAVSSPTAASGTSAPAAPARPGGTIAIRWFTGDPPDLDPYLNNSGFVQQFAGFFYSRLLKYDSGPGIDPNAFIPVPDLAEKYDVSRDGLT
jgi:peptide/nickel transport system substrate-binding protein